MRIGFIGSGSMVSAIARGAVAASWNGADFLFTSSTGESAQNLAAELGATALDSNVELAQQADLIVLGVKPQYQASVIAEIANTVADRTEVAVLSIAAGRTLTAIATDFGLDIAILRAMPNVNAQIGQSMTALVANPSTTEEQKKVACALLCAVGAVEWIDEKDFPVFTALAGSSPAWVFQMIDAFGRAGVKYGMTKRQAVACAAQAFAGSAQLLLSQAEDGVIPTQLIDSVTSPGGTTIAGLLAAEEAGLSTAIVHAVDAAVGREHLLG